MRAVDRAVSRLLRRSGATLSHGGHCASCTTMLCPRSEAEMPGSWCSGPAPQRSARSTGTTWSGERRRRMAQNASQTRCYGLSMHARRRGPLHAKEPHTACGGGGMRARHGSRCAAVQLVGAGERAERGRLMPLISHKVAARRSALIKARFHDCLIAV
jgi:hypothetical protein